LKEKKKEKILLRANTMIKYKMLHEEKRNKQIGKTSKSLLEILQESLFQSLFIEMLLYEFHLLFFGNFFISYHQIEPTKYNFGGNITLIYKNTNEMLRAYSVSYVSRSFISLRNLSNSAPENMVRGPGG